MGYRPWDHGSWTRLSHAHIGKWFSHLTSTLSYSLFLRLGISESVFLLLFYLCSSSVPMSLVISPPRGKALALPHTGPKTEVT